MAMPRTKINYPANCRGCAKPLRPRRLLIKDWPGTVQHQALGLCKPCHKSGNYPMTDDLTSIPGSIGDCKGCHKPMRDRKATGKDVPGTVLHKAGGRCLKCDREASEMAGILAARNASSSSAGLANFIEARRKREELRARKAKMRMVIK